MKAMADRIEASRRSKGSQPETVALLGLSPPRLESPALAPTAPLAAKIQFYRGLSLRRKARIFLRLILL